MIPSKTSCHGESSPRVLLISVHFGNPKIIELDTWVYKKRTRQFDSLQTIYKQQQYHSSGTSSVFCFAWNRSNRYRRMLGTGGSDYCFSKVSVELGSFSSLIAKLFSRHRVMTIGFCAWMEHHASILNVSSALHNRFWRRWPFLPQSL